jgi:hypothetical protein
MEERIGLLILEVKLRKLISARRVAGMVLWDYYRPFDSAANKTMKKVRDRNRIFPTYQIVYSIS